MTDDTHVRPGWYPDPLGLPQTRWWDGHSWTEHTSDARRPLIPQTAASVAFANDDADNVAPEPPKSPAPPRSAPPSTPPAEAQNRTGPAELPAGIRTTPDAGWAGAAVALHSAQSAHVPMRIEIDVAGHPPLTVDTRFHTYTWQLDLERFPANPSAVRVSIELVSEDTPTEHELPGESLDALLWKIGKAAFPQGLAPWLRSGDRYRLARWPNITALQPDMDELRQTAMLANANFTAEELATASGRSADTVQPLLNTLSLMGVLETAPPEAPAPVSFTRAPEWTPPAASTGSTPTQPERPFSLFQRMRDRWGL